jgi:hypothetical protein
LNILKNWKKQKKKKPILINENESVLNQLRRSEERGVREKWRRGD